MTAFSLDDYQQQIRQQTEAALRQVLANLLADTPPHLAEAIRYAVLDGGKRMRPLLVHAAAKLNPQASAAAARHVGMAIEFIHVYSLIHDDLPAMDDDDLRRGRPTVHRLWDEATAILAGDALQPMAFRLLANTPDIDAETRLSLITTLAEAAGPAGMVGGQAQDLAAVGQTLDRAALTAMHRAKTGALIRAAVRMGGLIAGLTPIELARLDAYADAVGLAFQVHDDVLDEIGDEKILGKRTGADRARSKPSFTSLLGIEGARHFAKELVSTALSELDCYDSRADALRAVARYTIERTV